jgi:hypothetical protein
MKRTLLVHGSIRARLPYSRCASFAEFKGQPEAIQPGGMTFITGSLNPDAVSHRSLGRITPIR